MLLPDGVRRTAATLTSLGPPAWTPDSRSLIFARLDYVDPYRIYSDLYRARVGGAARRLTRAARLAEPDLSPDGRRVVAVANAGATNVLVVRDLESGRQRVLTAPDLDVHWSLPRWSPDGTRIAASRWSPGGLYDVVVLDSGGAVLRELTHDRALDTAPAWSPDGRYVLFSSDRTGIPDLYACDVADGSLWQVTNVVSGAFQPDVSPDGRWIAFSYYLSDGYHVARLPFDPTNWRPAPAPLPELDAPVDSAGLDATAGGAAHAYSPFPSVLPASWSGAVEGGTAVGLGLGVAASGEDAVERHLWALQATLYPATERFSGGGAYRYRGLGLPTLDLSAAQQWSVRAASNALRGDAGVPIASALLERERTLDLSATWLRRRWRSSAWLRPGAELSDLALSWEHPDAAGAFALRDYPLSVGATLGAGYSSARAYAISLGPQAGVSLSGSVEGHRYTRPFSGEQSARGYFRFTGRSRAFQSLALPGFARHVLALRADGGAESGSVSPGFSLGGASGGSAPLPVQLGPGTGIAFPVRGYPEGVQSGTRAVSASAEYRFPLWLVERGLGVLPVFLERLWGDAFLDAGTAWCPGGCTRPFLYARATPHPLASVGAELLVDLQLGFGAALPLRFGAALPLVDRPSHAPQLYVRLGRSF